ncbi:Dolichyl-diphosphooligosaccharide--protein glycosyltransferase subunit Swp1 [Glomus cerebriforme]|uniref:Ribophorin II n=1 Tax=Glomus cerebriforme TaxID=658196 RepID=A0A397TLM7_9GLOM|nr:Dolichyl-diphosphooligosaccharide--protein glycosyltransferase subunit Swp1 [Glomus cerebriforme]
MRLFFVYIVALSWQFFVLLFCTIVSAQEASERSFVITDLKLAVTTSDSVRKLTESVVYPSSLDKPIELSQGDNFKIIFTVQDKGTKKGIQPHQSMLILSSNQTGNQIPVIVTVRDGGKARAELDMKSAPEDLLSSPGSYSLNLIIGTFSHNNPIDYHIGTVNIDVPYTSSVPIKYGPKPEIHHIFKPDQKLPSIIISYSFVIIVLSPWLFLIGAWIRLGVNVSFLISEPRSLPAIISFLFTLLAIEILFYNYWTHLNIFQTLSWLSGLSILAFLLGQKALSDVQEWRLKGLR